MFRKSLTLKCCLFVVIVLTLLLLVLVAGNDEVEGKTITVNDDGGEDHKRIQDAVNAASDGDIIQVKPGTYRENIVVDKRIDLFGSGSKTTTIDGGGKWDVVRITADWVNMRGFSVTGSGSSDSIDLDAGIKVESDNNIISNNTCNSNNDNGISLWGSSDCKITNNTCNSNNGQGISLWDSRDCKITNNTCNSNNYYGICLVSSDNCTLSTNTCNSNNGQGIYLIDSRDCKIRNNTMNENGISIYDSSLETWNSHTVETTNTVNGKPVYYYKNVTGFTVPYGAGQVVLANCSWINVENQNCSNGSVGILVGYSSNITLTNNTCSENSYYGIQLDDSSACTITSNTCENNVFGISLFSSRACTIEDNTCSTNGQYGVYLLNSSYCKITNNDCENNYYGIYLRDSRDCKITNNSGRIKVENDDTDDEDDDDDDDDDSLGSIVLGLLLGALLLLFSLLFVSIGRSPKERKGKPPEGMEESGGVDKGSKE